MSNSADFEIIFVRHAHRDTSEPSRDNGLTPKGQDQVKTLVNLYKTHKLPEANIFWTSPKVRCVETLKPLAEAAKAELIIEPLLVEQGSQESQQVFEDRINKLIKKSSGLKKNLYLCSHGDLIPEAIMSLTGYSVNISKGQAIVLCKNADRWRLK